MSSVGPFTDWQHSGVGRSATITGLNASTLYYVRVRAGNAEGVGSWSPTANFTVRDVGEAPSAPSAPSLSSPSSTSLFVSWSAPSNKGPAISDYDVGYGLSSVGPFTDWQHSGVGRSATITGLNVSTLYFVRVLARNGEGDSGWSPTANFTTGTTVTNNPPVFSSSSSFSVNENSDDAGRLVASDPNNQDSVTGYSVSGGVDSARFFTNGGFLSFRFPPDYERPADSGRNNVYNVVVTATSGTGGRVRTATQSITVTVRDVDEAPSAPSAPSLSSPSNTSLFVSWSAPSNTGPAISDYDVGYGMNSNGPFTDWSHSDASRSATITGLNASTLYYVRVLARNAEGSSGWSPTANFTTGSTSVTNDPPVFSSSSGFSVNENVRGVGTVVASDLDNRDAVSGYVVSGGVDSAFFSITSGGVLTFNSVPNYESPQDGGTDNVYALEVEASSGTGGRVRTATQSVTVTVNDVAEAPSAPSTPVLSSPNSTSLLVSWSVPSNTGPSILDYGVQYREGTSGTFSNWSHSDASRRATITGLNVSTLYYVRVLARNAEGSSGWSPTASFTTGSVVNTPPVFSSSSSFSVNENTFVVGTVVASDNDGQDNVTGYRVSGGADSGRLLVRNGDLLVFRFAPDYESPVDSGGDNVYNFVVTATSGTGGRVRTATQSIVVTVVDVVEVPSAPADAVTFVSSLNQLTSFSDVLGYPDDIDWKFIARPFTSGTHPQGYVLQGAKIDLELGSSSRNAVVGIYSSGDIINVNDKLLGDKLYDLTGSINSAGVRTFSAPLGAVLNANTTYFLLIRAGSGNGTFALATTGSLGVDSSSQSGWSMGGSLYTYNNNESVYYPGGLKAEIFGINRSANSIATGKPSIEGLVQVNKILTANVSRISDSNGIPVGSFVYQWVRVDGGEETNISGANESTYTVVDADEGNRLKVVVSFVDDGGFSEGPLVSDATALVSALVNNPPVFSSSSSFSVNENTVRCWYGCGF